MLFQYLSGFEPIFYTTHTNEEPKNDVVYGAVNLKEGTRECFTNCGRANNIYSLYISRTYRGNDTVSYVNGKWSPDK